VTRATTTGGKRRWVWAAGSAVAVVCVFSLLFGLVRPPSRGTVSSVVRQTIGLDQSQSDSALKEGAMLLDPAPLFLPTKWNAAQKVVDWPEPGGAFQNYRIEPKLSFPDAEPNLGLPPPVAVPAKPLDALTVVPPGALAAGFGRADVKIEPLASRGAYVQIVAARTGQPALPQQTLEQLERLAAQASPPKPPSGQQWQPIEFLAAVDAAGLIGPPVIVELRSGEEEVARYFQNFLVQTLRVGERLVPGVYRISVGP